MEALHIVNLLISTHESITYYLPGDVWQKQYTLMRELKKHLEKTPMVQVDDQGVGASILSTSAS